MIPRKTRVFGGVEGSMPFYPAAGISDQLAGLASGPHGRLPAFADMEL